MLRTYIHTDRHTDPLTKWVVEELSLLKKTKGYQKTFFLVIVLDLKISLLVKASVEDWDFKRRVYSA